MKNLFLVIITIYLFAPATTQAFLYTPENIHTAYQEVPSTFSFNTNGEAVGATISGIPFRQRNITNTLGVRLQRFEIGLAYWYVSDRGVIWANSDLEALSIYISRIG